MKSIIPLLGVLITATVALAQASALADSAATIQTYASSTGVTFDDNGSGNYPVITTMLTVPGTVTGTAGSRTYNNYSFLAQDTTGSLDLFYASSLVPGYTPAVGDWITAQGNYAPYSGIPEIANSATHPISVSYQFSSGNSPYFATPALTTIPTINVGTNGYGLSQSGLSGQAVQLKNVTMSGLGATWSGNPNSSATGTITDESLNSMTLYVWATSYLACGQIVGSGAAIPTGLVDMTGFVSDFYSTVTSSIQPEFVPLSITEVPEPSTMAFCGLGSVLAWVCYRLRKKV
jgi:hypothetical protein